MKLTYGGSRGDALPRMLSPLICLGLAGLFAMFAVTALLVSAAIVVCAPFSFLCSFRVTHK